MLAKISPHKDVACHGCPRPTSCRVDLTFLGPHLLDDIHYGCTERLVGTPTRYVKRSRYKPLSIAETWKDTRCPCIVHSRKCRIVSSSTVYCIVCNKAILFITSSCCPRILFRHIETSGFLCRYEMFSLWLEDTGYTSGVVYFMHSYTRSGLYLYSTCNAQP
jgi:hypothetical protein